MIQTPVEVIFKSTNKNTFPIGADDSCRLTTVPKPWLCPWMATKLNIALHLFVMLGFLCP